MTFSNTRSFSNTYTESRSRYVVGKLYEDLLGIYFRGFITKKLADKWREDILYMTNNQVLKSIEIQFYRPDGRQNAICYDLKNDGNISEDNDSGEFDYYLLPNNTNVSIVAILDQDASNYNVANKELANRGWASGGIELQDSKNFQKSYSKDGYGFDQYTKGSF